MHKVPAAGRATAIALVLTILALAVSGCMRVARTLQVNADGSGFYALTIGFREPRAGDPSSVATQVSEPMDAFAAHVQQTGGSYRRYSDQTYAYWAFTRSFDSVTAADALLQDGPQQFDANHNPVLFRDTLHIRREPGLLGTTYHITGTLSLVDLLNNAQNWQEATETLTVTMPGGIRSAHGGTRAGNSVTYTIAYNQSATVDVVGEAGGALSPFALVAVALGLVAVALAVIGFVLVTRASKAARAAR